MTTQTGESRIFAVTITCPLLARRETVVVEAADAGAAQPAAIAATTLPLNGEEIFFHVCELPSITDGALYARGPERIPPAGTSVHA